MSQEAYDLLEAAMARRRALEDNYQAYMRGVVPPHYAVPATMVDVAATLPQQLCIYHNGPIEWIISK